MKNDLKHLQYMQALPLNLKIKLTRQRLREWINEYGLDGVYISFSGGKDSTVLLTMAREWYPDIKAVFVDTGLEYPEVREFVKTWDNVDWVKPKYTFKQVIEKYGYPMISKEVSECVYGARKYLTKIISENNLDRPTDRPTDLPYSYRYDKLCGLGKFAEDGRMRRRQEVSEGQGDRRILSRRVGESAHRNGVSGIRQGNRQLSSPEDHGNTPERNRKSDSGEHP